MDCLIKEKKNKKVIIWTLDGSPKFYQIEFNELEIDSNIKLKIAWNRPIKGFTDNMITIKLSHSNVFFEEKTVGINQFLIEYPEIIDEIYSNMNRKLLLQGMTVYKKHNADKTNKYVKKIIKYINKKESKKEKRKSKKEQNILHLSN
tara:strand:- start:211 stop:651 length:441 start_codon:yes stop_codon:yes gene_type:complete